MSVRKTLKNRIRFIILLITIIVMLATSTAILSVLYKAIRTSCTLISNYEAKQFSDKINNHNFLKTMNVSALEMINETCVLNDEMKQSFSDDIKNSIHLKGIFPGYDHVDKVYAVVLINNSVIFSNIPKKYIKIDPSEEILKNEFLEKMNHQSLWVLQGTESVLPIVDNQKNKIGSIFVVVNPKILASFSIPVICAIGFLILLFLIALYFIAALLVKPIVVPLDQLSEKLSALAAKDNEVVMSSKIELSRPLEEIEELASATNDIIGKIGEYNKQIVDQKEVLDQQNKTFQKQNFELVEAGEMLKQMNATKNKFFSIISHDLKGPFNGMIGLSGLLNDTYDSLSEEEKREYIRVINNSSKGMYNLLENLLQWSRMQTKGLQYQPKATRLLQLVTDNFHALDIMAKNKKIAMRHSVSDEVILFVDVDMINTVLRNLLTNALKFTFIGGEINVSVSCERNLAEVAVKDNGMGIEPTDLDKLFRIDEKVASKGTADETGTGLGLILCKELVEKNGGTIWVESEIGKGTVFKFTVPTYIA